MMNGKINMHARIYQPSKNAMQSGRGREGQWVLEYEPETPRQPEPLMGWSSSGDTLNQIRLRFDSREEAEAFAKTKKLQYVVQEAHKRKLRPRNYGDRFQSIPQD
jgi:hypothetical protein